MSVCICLLSPKEQERKLWQWFRNIEGRDVQTTGASLWLLVKADHFGCQINFQEQSKVTGDFYRWNYKWLNRSLSVPILEKTRLMGFSILFNLFNRSIHTGKHQLLWLPMQLVTLVPWAMTFFCLDLKGNFHCCF